MYRIKKMEIRQRKYDFAFKKYWFNDSKWLTYFGNANSLLFEVSEEIATKVIKFNNKKIKDVELNKEVDILYAQECWHRFNHQKFNEQVGKFYNIEKLRSITRSMLAVTLTKNSLGKLSDVVSFEKYAGRLGTCIVCSLLKNQDKTVKDFWEWHKLEELEHKDTVVKMYEYFNPKKLFQLKSELIFVIWYVKVLFTLIKEFYNQDEKIASI